MLYTRKGDNGTTKTFGAKERISKSSPAAEALGSLDEANSYLGVLKKMCVGNTEKIRGETVPAILHRVQNDLFIVQAEIAGADKALPDGETEFLEGIIDAIEKTLPPIKSFFIPGADEISAHFDFARTLVRRAERRIVAVHDEKIVAAKPETLRFLNRLSSLLYALARHAAHIAGTPETPPTY
ncbi:MAG: cob(I)yrinic acid a,c-diamide adenosyltransferase [Patescibacteria group bacterium]|nr:cob(I)yrinic acid a,c-diamide adenosyltransferase [Patescibacteria group bacterium]MDE1945687.1 cob(I)yrinic acid a,c-diamide adenosyltransferase [Patescibacteria group bacterium]